jgi:sugar lactone lactonase YvrE
MTKTAFILPLSIAIATVGGLSLEISPARATLLVGNTEGNNIVLFDERNGRYIGDFIASGSGGLLRPDDLDFGPDGNLYISSGTTPSNSAILRFNGRTGQFIDVFASGGGLSRPYGTAFGPDGFLYVSSFLTDQILRYNATTGAFFDVFASGNGAAGGLNGPNQLLFAPDNSLLVTTQGSVAVNNVPDFSAGLPSQVLRFDIATGNSSVFIDQPAPSPDGFGFVSLLGLSRGPNGDLFVSDFANDIRRYNFTTGALISEIATNYTGTIPSNNFIGNLTFDTNNTIYSVGFDFSQNNFGAILRYDGVTGAPLPSPGNTSAILTPTTNRLLRPIGILFTPESLTPIPEPSAAIALLSFGATLSIVKRKRNRQP